MPTPQLTGSVGVSAADGGVLERNVRALMASSPWAAQAVLGVMPRADVHLFLAADGALTGAVGFAGEARQLASRYRPLEEARRLAGQVPLAQCGAVLVPGLGVGHHARALLERVPRPSGTEAPPWGVLVVFEPDVALLRAVLEQVDHSDWLGRGDVVVLTEATPAAIAQAMRGREALPFLGEDCGFLEHPAQVTRLGPLRDEFYAAFRQWLSASRTSAMTTLVNSPVAIENALRNMPTYLTAAGVADLAGCGRGRPAVVVAAGPSLRRNVHQLRDPDVQERFCIVAVQTVLRPLLREGIRPHVVVALDYHELSRRFYEGLTAQDVRGMALVVEAKASPAILEAWPGAVRMPADRFLDDLLGAQIAGVRGSLRPGATVAHMGYYLARLMGCDPVILVGHDLGFTDGQYYAAGAAIHEVWGSELNEFRTLEMLEWERIVRGRYRLNTVRDVQGRELAAESNLVRCQDVLGRPIYTDQQMATYLTQFERDFREDEARGLTVVDATEGGVRKEHTRVMSLAEALRAFLPAGPWSPPAPEVPADAGGRLRRGLDRVRGIRQDVWRIAGLSRETARLLEEMRRHQRDQARVNRLIARVYAIRDQVQAMQPAFALVQYVNQAGVLKRLRADRAMALGRADDPIERQRQEIERDLMNVGWIAEAADGLGRMLDEAARRLGREGSGPGPRLSREPGQVVRPCRRGSEHQAAARKGTAARKVWAMIAADLRTGALGVPRDARVPLAQGRPALWCVLRRLARCQRLEGAVVVVSDTCPAGDERSEVAAVGELIGPGVPGLRVEVVGVPAQTLRRRRRAIAAARLWSAACWRGGLGGMTVYDEVCPAAAFAPVMAARDIEAAVIVGCDQALVDPDLVDQAASRFSEGGARLVFCQAPPGVGVCVVARSLMEELAANETSAGVLATLGARLAYSPLFPMPDPIACLRAEESGRPVCVPAPPRVRDAGLRLVADCAAGQDLLARMLHDLGPNWPGADATDVVCSAGRVLARSLAVGPREFVIRVETADQLAAQVAALRRALRGRDDAVLTLEVPGSVLERGDWPRAVEIVRAAGLAGVHIRTDLRCERPAALTLLTDGPEVISVDLLAESAATYRALTGTDEFARVRGNLEAMLDARSRRGTDGGIPMPWIVPRITKCDATYEEIEAFYDRWLLGAGAAVIDPLPAEVPGARIAPLPLPERAAARRARERVVLGGGISAAAEETCVPARERPAREPVGVDAGP